MESDGKLAQWAALFVKTCSNDAAAEAPAVPPAIAEGLQYSGVTQAACELLRAVDSGGVPAFVTGNLKQIAQDNGVALSDESTPNEIVEAIRSKARASPGGEGGGAG